MGSCLSGEAMMDRATKKVGTQKQTATPPSTKMGSFLSGEAMIDQATKKMGAQRQQEREQKAAMAVAPPNDQWVGQWVSLSHPIRYIVITAEGMFTFQQPGASAINDQPVVKWSDDGLQLGADPRTAQAMKLARNMGVDASVLSPDWSVEKAPHNEEESGELRMTVRGVEYKRT